MSRFLCPRRFAAAVVLSACTLIHPHAAAAQTSGAAELEPITVESRKARNKPAQQTTKVKPKAAAPAPKPAASAPTPLSPAPSAEPPSGTGKATKPGLNLKNPNTAGSRLNLTPLQTPASVEVIAGDTIRERGQQTVNEAVTQDAAGFSSTASSGDGGTSFSTRGFAGTSSISQFYDGTKLYVAAGTVTFPFNTWSADRIEVLRGPASVLYGDGAIGGIVNVVPKKPTDTFISEAEIAIGTDWTRRLSFGSGGPISDQLAYRLDVTGTQSEGWFDQQGEFADAAMSGALRYKPASNLVFTLSNDYGYQEPVRYWGTPLIDGRLDERLRDTNFNVRDSEIEYRDNWTQFKAEWSPTAALTLRNTAYRLTSKRHWRNAEEYYFDADFDDVPGPDFPGTIGRTSFLEIFHDQEQIGDRFDATLRHTLFGLRTQTLVGFDVNRVRLDYTDNFRGNSAADYVDPDAFEPGSFLADPASPSFRAKLDLYSLFGETRLELTEQLSVIGGIRLERPEVERIALRPGRFPYDEDFSEVTWRAGAVYTVVPGLAVYGQYSTGIDPLSNLLTLSNTQAVSELTTGRQVEVGIKQSFWNGRGEWTVAAYDIEKDNLLVSDPNDPTSALQIGKQSSRGIEISLALQLTQAIRAEGNLAILDARYDTFFESADDDTVVSRAGNRPFDVPETVANFWLAYKFAPRWEARAGIQYVDERFSDTANLRVLPDYTIVNAGLDYAVTSNSKLSLRGYNVLDEVYPVVAYGPNWVLGKPRSAELSYRIQF
jgi:iron complex outermembrane receptor protein